MGYIRDVLGTGETLEYEARVSHWSFLPAYFGMGLCIIGALMLAGVEGMGNMSAFLTFVAIGIAAKVLIAYYGTELGLTTRRVIAKTGIIRRDTVEINLGKVESIQIAQSVLGRIFDFGTITIAGSGTSHAPIRGVADPIAFRKKFDETCTKYKQAA